MKTNRINKNEVTVTMTIDEFSTLRHYLNEIVHANNVDSNLTCLDKDFQQNVSDFRNALGVVPVKYKGWIKDRLTEEQDAIMGIFNANKVTATLRKDDKNIHVQATLEHPAVSYGQPIWVDDDNNPICQCDLEEMAGYEIVSLWS